MNEIQNYLATLTPEEKKLISHMYDVVRRIVPETTEELSYAMPSLKYRGKGLVAIMANKNFLSLYPFGSVGKLGVDLSGFQTTSGSIHFTKDSPISDDLLKKIVIARKLQIEQK